MGVSEGNAARDFFLGGGGGGEEFMCDRERKGGAARERECSQQCMCEHVCMHLDEKLSVD